jgi:hypothetical protein
MPLSRDQRAEQQRLRRLRAHTLNRPAQRQWHREQARYARLAAEIDAVIRNHGVPTAKQVRAWHAYAAKLSYLFGDAALARVPRPWRAYAAAHAGTVQARVGRGKRALMAAPQPSAPAPTSWVGAVVEHIDRVRGLAAREGV